jgi:hypothetical protein
MGKRCWLIAFAVALAAAAWAAGEQETEFAVQALGDRDVEVLVPKSVPGDAGAVAVATRIAPKPGAMDIRAAIDPSDPKKRISIDPQSMGNWDIYVRPASGGKESLLNNKVYVEIVIGAEAIPVGHTVYVLHWDAKNPKQSVWVPLVHILSGAVKIPGLKIERLRHTNDEYRFLVTDWPTDDMEVAHG